MNILYVAHRLPFPPDKGDKIRSFRVIEHLARRHKLWCACFVDDPSEQAHVVGLREFCVDVAAISLNRWTATARGACTLALGGVLTRGFYRDARMSRVLAEWGSTIDFDAVVAFSSSMAPYALEVRAKRRVLDLCDLDSRKWLDYANASRAPLSWLYAAEGKRLAAWERSLISTFDASTVITPREALTLRGFVPLERVHVITNGVHLPDPGAVRVPSARPCSDAGVVGFLGVMNYRPNVDGVRWFVETCWPKVRQAFPQAEFRVVGRRPTRAVRSLASRAGVAVVGEVPSVLNELRRLDVSVAPLRIARGLQNKVLESMAAGVAMVATSEVAACLNVTPAQEMLVADGARGFTRATIRLLDAAELRQRIAAAGRRYVATHHRWSDALTRFEALITGAVEREIDTSDIPSASGVRFPLITRVPASISSTLHGE